MATRLGLIGTGRWGKNYIKTIKGLPDIELTAHAGSGPDSKPQQDAGKFFPYWEDMLDKHVVDGIIIATPAESHFQIAAPIIAMGGFQVLLEKPACLGLRETDSLLKITEWTNTNVMVGHIDLHNRSYVELVCRMQESMEIVTSIECEVASDLGFLRENYSVLWDWAPHALAMIVHPFFDIGHPMQIDIHSASQIGPAFWQTHFEMFANPGDMPIQVDLKISGVSPTKKRRIQFNTGSGKRYVYDDCHATPAMVNDDPIEPQLPPQTPLESLVKKFAYYCEHPVRIPRHSDLYLAANTARILEAIEEAL